MVDRRPIGWGKLGKGGAMGRDNGDTGKGTVRGKKRGRGGIGVDVAKVM